MKGPWSGSGLPSRSSDGPGWIQRNVMSDIGRLRAIICWSQALWPVLVACSVWLEARTMENGRVQIASNMHDFMHGMRKRLFGMRTGSNTRRQAGWGCCLGTGWRQTRMQPRHDPYVFRSFGPDIHHTARKQHKCSVWRTCRALLTNVVDSNISSLRCLQTKTTNWKGRLAIKLATVRWNRHRLVPDARCPLRPVLLRSPQQAP